GKTVQDLIVGIHALPGIAGGGAELGEEGGSAGRRWRKKNNRQAGGVAVRKCWRHVAEPERAGAEILMLREESFHNSGPAITNFVDLGGRNDGHVRKRN